MKKMIIQGMLALLLFNSMQSFGQEAITTKTTQAVTYVIKSQINKKEYVLNVMLPDSYSASDSIRYPVLYILDGRYSTSSFYSIKEIFGLGKELREIIFVTIDGNVKTETEWLANRNTDLTPSNDSPFDTAIARFFKIPVSPSGGAFRFLTTIENDIIPLIESRYKTNGERGIFGHSLGGLFAAYCLLNKPDLFQQYSLNSPSVWWNKSEMVAMADSIAKRNPNIQANIFISAGSLEGNFMIGPVNNFIRSLKNDFPGLKITSKIFEDETHLSVVPAASSRTLKVLYSQ